MKNLSRTLLVVAALALVISIFAPIWRIELDAPQYPEGLNLLIYSNKLGGNVEIVNGLNHYIGMKTLHAEDFIEFTVLPYIIAGFAIFSLLVAFTKKRVLLNSLFISFVLFGIIAMIDFWRWEYDYGHDLDPNAAIVVPGMAYQPPLIGFKQLLNFGAYSIPDIGGWLFILAGLLMLLVVFYFEKSMRMPFMKKGTSMLFIAIVGFTSCMEHGPTEIVYNTDACDYCKMTISDNRFACEFISAKGRTYKFDDLACLSSFQSANKELDAKEFYVADYSKPGLLFDHKNLKFIYSDEFGSPMAGNIAAFSVNDSLSKYNGIFKSNLLGWAEILAE